MSALSCVSIRTPEQRGKGEIGECLSARWSLRKALKARTLRQKYEVSDLLGCGLLRLETGEA